MEYNKDKELLSNPIDGQAAYVTLKKAGEEFVIEGRLSISVGEIFFVHSDKLFDGSSPGKDKMFHFEYSWVMGEYYQRDPNMFIITDGSVVDIKDHPSNKFLIEQ